MEYLKKVKEDLSNFPDEVINEWLLPYAQSIGWPPTHERWRGIFFSKPLEFWQATTWQKQNLNLATAPYSAVTQ